MYLVFIYDANDRVCMVISCDDVLSNRLRSLTRFVMVYLQWLRSIRLRCPCCPSFDVEATSYYLAFQEDWLQEMVGWCCPGSPHLRRACTRSRLVHSRTVETACYDPFLLLWPLPCCPHLSQRRWMNWIPRFHHRFLPPLRYSSAKRSFFSYLISYWLLTSAGTVFMMIPVFVLSTVDQISCHAPQTMSTFSLVWL